MSYISIRVSTLRGDQKIDFNTYVKINEKMVLYLRRGESFEGRRLKRLKERNLRKMFILSDDEKKYLGYLKRNIEMAYDNSSGKDIQGRAEIIQGMQQGSAEDVFENPDSANSYDYAKEAAGRYVNFITTNAQALAAIVNLDNTDKNIAHHGVTVSTLAIALAHKLGITDPKRTQLLSLGALLHDYGHHNSELNVVQPLGKMSFKDKALWNQHPKVGATNVQDKKHFDQTVITLIMQHEETINGAGPLGLYENELDPLSVIVSTANALDRLITFEGTPKGEAAKKLMIEHIGKYPLQYIQFLNEVLKGI